MHVRCPGCLREIPVAEHELGALVISCAACETRFVPQHAAPVEAPHSPFAGDPTRLYDDEMPPRRRLLPGLLIGGGVLLVSSVVVAVIVVAVATADRRPPTGR
jgi:hypothetical protein